MPKPSGGFNRGRRPDGPPKKTRRPPVGGKSARPQDRTPRPQVRSPRPSLRPGPPPKDLTREWFVELRDTAHTEKQDELMALVTKALESFAAGDYARAASLATQAKARAPRSGRLRELLGLAHYHSGNWNEAAGELLAYRRLTAGLDQNHVIADCYRALGRFDRALEVCNEVGRKQVSDEVWTEVTIVAASALADKGALDQALARLSQGELKPATVEPHHLRLWYVRADLMERSGRKQEAKEIWETIFNIDRDFYDAEDRLNALRGL
jgi:tetratricopeptide (TPR) repeat protein